MVPNFFLTYEMENFDYLTTKEIIMKFRRATLVVDFKILSNAHDIYKY